MSLRNLLPCSLMLLFLGAASAQIPLPEDPEKQKPVRLPNGKLQSEEIIKADYQKNLDDAAKLIETAQAFRAELEKETQHVLSLSTLKRLDEMERLTRRLRSRMKK